MTVTILQPEQFYFGSFQYILMPMYFNLSTIINAAVLLVTESFYSGVKLRSPKSIVSDFTIVVAIPLSDIASKTDEIY